MGKALFTYKDYDGESSVATFPIINLTEATIAAQLTLLGTLRTAVDNVTLGLRQKTAYVAQETQHTSLSSDEPTAQRELKWFVRMHETTTLKPMTLEIPCADPDLLDPNNRDHLNVDVGEPGAALVAAIEAVVVGPSSQLVEVDEIILVARRT